MLIIILICLFFSFLFFFFFITPRFDLHATVHQLDRISQWRIETLSQLLTHVFSIDNKLPVRVLHVFLTGDNEYLCKEIGIPGGMHYASVSLGVCYSFIMMNAGSTRARCFGCALVSPLFPYIPFGGQPRTLQTACDWHKVHEHASTQFAAFALETHLRVADKSAIDIWQRIASGYSISPPLLAIRNTQLPLQKFTLVLPLMHNLANVCSSVSLFLFLYSYILFFFFFFFFLI